ncbi:L-xylulokinase [Lachnospiraceae bacterium PF1-21]
MHTKSVYIVLGGGYNEYKVLMKGGESLGKYLMGLDNGGTVTKCGIYSLDGQEICVASKEPKLFTPKPDFTEREGAEVLAVNYEVIREALKLAEEEVGMRPEQIACIGLTGYGNGICLVDNKGTLTRNAIVSTDDRGTEMVAYYREKGIEKEVYNYTRQTMWSAMVSSLLSWLCRYEREVVESSAYVLGIKDYIRYHLTGEFQMEFTEASSSGLMNVTTHRFESEVFRLLEIPQCEVLMPEIVGCDEVSGYITEEAARKTGLSVGTPVAGGCFDVDGAMLASGILDEQTLCMVAGTWSINEYLSPEWNWGYRKTTNSVSLSYLPGYYLVEESTPTSSSNLAWFVEEFIKVDRKDCSQEELYAYCNEAAQRIKPEESEVIFVPYLFSSATHPDGKGSFLNLAGSHTREHLIRAIYEGVVFSSARHVKMLKAGNREFALARLSGGLTKSEVWTQMMSDVLNLPVEVIKVEELSALGAAMCGGVAAGIFENYREAIEKMVEVEKCYEPNPEVSEIYKRKFARYEQALRAIDYFCEEALL